VPLYWISFGFSIAVAVLCYGKTYNISGHSFQKYDFADAIKNMFFLQGIFCEPWTLNVVVWTISIEVFFYTLAPWLKKLKPVVILGFIIFSAASFILWRYIGSAQVWQLKYGLPMLLLAWSWLAGYWIYIKNTDCSAILLICSIGFFALAFHNVYLPYLWPITFLIPIIALAFSGNIYLSQTTTKLFDWMGDISYPIYLFHIPIFSLLFVFSESNKWYIYIICMIAITAIIDALLDKPLKKFLKNVFLSFAAAGNPK
jgi:peptidoglycan/LPS O-acetylase OafA/YrhL